MTDEDVARYLRENPGFLERNPGALLHLELPDPHAGNAVSLLERQAVLQRERIRALETRLAELMQIGRENDALARSLDEWTRALLAHPGRDGLDELALAQLQRAFGVPLGLVRRWSPVPGSDDAPLARLAASLGAARCCDPALVRGTGGTGEAWEAAASAAVIPLRRTGEPSPFGVMILGSPDAERFDQALGTALLARIGALASAALGALPPPAR